MSTRSTFSVLFFYNKSQLNKDGEAPIYVRVTVNSKKKEFSLKRSIDPKLWDTLNGKALGTTKESKALNTYIDSVKFILKDHERSLREQNIPITAENLKNAFLGIDKNEKSILAIFAEHNERIKVLVKNGEYSYETQKRYNTSYIHTKNFISSFYHCADLPLRKIDHRFVTDLEYYFKSERKCSHNTTMKYLKNFKKIIYIALANGWMKHDPFLKFKITLKKVDRGFLSEDELQSIISKNFHVERLNQIKDCFLFSCFTGLAYSDLAQLTPDDIVIGTDGGKWIKINRKKTNTQSNIPILPVTQSIIDKYSHSAHREVTNRLLPVPTNQKMNAYLKEIADLCDIKQNLTSHLARHTFATTVTLNNDVPIESVSKMLGHSSINITKIYARLLDKKVGQDMKHLNDKYSIAI